MICGSKFKIKCVTFEFRNWKIKLNVDKNGIENRADVYNVESMDKLLKEIRFKKKKKFRNFNFKSLHPHLRTETVSLPANPHRPFPSSIHFEHRSTKKFSFSIHELAHWRTRGGR